MHSKPERGALTPAEIAAVHVLDHAAEAAWERIAAAYCEERRRFLALPGATVELANQLQLLCPDPTHLDHGGEA